MSQIKQIFLITSLLVSTNSFALSLGTIQRTKDIKFPGVQGGDYQAETQSMAQIVCNQQGLRLPTPNELLQIGSNPINTNELKNVAFWSSEKGTILNGNYGWVATNYDWDDLVAGIICI